jgi:hypothetical protein
MCVSARLCVCMSVCFVCVCVCFCVFVSVEGGGWEGEKPVQKVYRWGAVGGHGEKGKRKAGGN